MLSAVGPIHADSDGGALTALIQIRRWSALVLTSSVLLAMPPSAAAQELYGSVVGTVQDNTGALIPGATIELANRETTSC